jgi:galactose-1-phosphate uridylyltransferase
VQEQFAEKFPETPVPHRSVVRRLTKKFRETAIIAYIRNILQADLQKVFANKIKWVYACIDARGHHFQRLL